MDNVIAIITLLTFSGPPYGLYRPMKRLYRLLIRHIGVGAIFRSLEQNWTIFRLYEHEMSRRDEMARDPRRDPETFWAETETRPR